MLSRFQLSLVIFLLLQPWAATAQESTWISVEISTDQLVQIDIQNGSASAIGSAGIDLGDFLDTATMGNLIYALDWDSNQFQVRLLELDIENGTATQLAILEENGIPITFARGLATDNQQLFVAYSGSPTSFESTKLGTVALDGRVTFVTDTGIDISGLTNDDVGNLYGFANYFDATSNDFKTDFYSLNPLSLMSTLSDSPLFNGIEFQNENIFLAISALELVQIDTSHTSAMLSEVTSIFPNGNYRSLLQVIDDEPTCKTNPELQWGVGDTSPDFSSFRIGLSGEAEPVTWNEEVDLETDYYVVSTCAMWCGPCQQFAVDSQALKTALSNLGIQIKTYDWIFQNPVGSDPDSDDALDWIQNVWTTDPENVWFSGDLSLENCNNVIENIFLSNDENAIPNILILDNTLRICGQMSGYDNSTLVNLIVELDTIFGDVNQDGLTNLLDVQPFISVLSTGTYQIEADCNQDGVVNLLDIAFFVDILSS